MNKGKMNFLVCPSCGGNLNRVTDSRQSVDDGEMRGVKMIRRRRICDDCGDKHTTLELPTKAFPAALSAKQLSALQHPEVQIVVGRLFAEGKL
jgi:transcriptional regulator NrdR family protein